VSAAAEPDGPLTGVRVLDLTSVVMGPLATQIFGDLGADVITIERREGDTSRHMGAGPHPELSGIAMNLLRNKRNVALDISTPGGRDALLRIATTCDVFVTNMRPGALARAHLTYEDIVAVRPDVIYCQAQGFPSDSQRANEPAYDDIMQAASGVADAARRATGTAMLAPTILADKVTALMIAYAVTSALYRRERTGCGEHIEVPMVDATTAFVLTEHGSAAIARPPQGEAGYRRILTAQRRPQRTRDGWINILPYSQEHYDDLFRQGGRHELVGDARTANLRARVESADFLYSRVHEIVAHGTTQEWLDFCRARNIPVTEVASLDDLVDALPEADHPVVGRYKVIPPPVRFRNAPMSVRRPAPLIGQHTDEVLGEVGFSEEEIARLREVGGIPGA
jgi:crotonobetainyl-CoA:carnitine CoA-transferase CaiB-like acyl-CoA transferase